MASGEIRTGVVGLGYFGSFHARHHAANPKARLVGVVDADRGRAEAHGAEHGAEPLSDHRELIGRVDAVSITVPTSLHHAVAADFIDAGVDVLIEKPIADSEAAAVDLVRRAEKSGVVLQVGHIERFSPVFRALAGNVVAPRVAEFTRIGPWKGRAIDVDVVLDLMIHDIDLALTLMAEPVADVQAMGSPIFAPTNDFAHAQLTFASGARAELTASRVADRSERTIRVVEADRWWNADLALRTIRSGPRGDPAAVPDSVAVPPSDNLALQIDAFLESVARRTGPVVDGKAGLDALRVAERILDRIKAPRGTSTRT